MKKQPVKIKSIVHETHDVLQIVTLKPDNAHFVPGQATEIFLDKTGWENEGRPFTFTGLPNQDHLEFLIKTYPEHKGVTYELLNLQKGDELILNEIFGAINYKGEGTFIAGGAGVTPFVSIFRDLRAKDKIGNNRLLFANKTKADIILEKEFTEMLGNHFVNILSDEKTEEYAHGLIGKDFITQNCASLEGFFYVCGPPPMMQAIERQLVELNIKKNMIIMEKF